MWREPGVVGRGDVDAAELGCVVGEGGEAEEDHVGYCAVVLDEWEQLDVRAVGSFVGLLAPDLADVDAVSGDRGGGIGGSRG